MSKVAIDIDETLYSFDTAIRNAFFDMAEERNDKSILRLAYSNNHEWRNLVDHDKAVAYEAIERVHERADDHEPFPDAEDVVSEIAKAGHKIVYIGSRFEKHREVTESFLWWNCFPPGELICADPTQSKLPLIKDCQYLIDDRPKTIFEFLYDSSWDNIRWENDSRHPPLTISAKDNSRKAFALWRPYNQNLTELKNLYLVPTWRGLLFYLERKGVI